MRSLRAIWLNEIPIGLATIYIPCIWKQGIGQTTSMGRIHPKDIFYAYKQGYNLFKVEVLAISLKHVRELKHNQYPKIYLANELDLGDNYVWICQVNIKITDQVSYG